MSRLRWLLFLLLAGAANTAPAETVVAHEQGRQIYNYRCYFCHGYSGNAQTLASTYLVPAPRNFTRTDAAGLPRAAMIDTVTRGKPGTAMHGFSRVLDKAQIELVVDFVREEFMQRQNPNTRYHTRANGWPEHERYQAAFPFATGQIPLDRPWESLSPEQVRGKRLYLVSCITCHDRSTVENEGAIWRKQAVSYPRNNYSHTAPDAISAASIYARHDSPPAETKLSRAALAGQSLWQQNCAFCHAADGTGENWIGSFLEPAPRDLTDPAFMRHMTPELLRLRIRDGLANTSMPAWKDVLDSHQIDQIVTFIDEAFHPLAAQ